jgi:hypothetical protein
LKHAIINVSSSVDSRRFGEALKRINASPKRRESDWETHRGQQPRVKSARADFTDHRILTAISQSRHRAKTGWHCSLSGQSAGTPEPAFGPAANALHLNDLLDSSYFAPAHVLRS